MSDEELRALEREVARTATPAARLALAQALERAGREAAAWEAAIPAARDPAVAEWLRRYPVWCTTDGDAGATRCIDLPAPRAGLARGATRELEATQDGLPRLGVSTASGCVGLQRMSPEHSLSSVLLDPQDASSRCALPGFVEWSHGDRLFARDLGAWTEDGQALTGLPRGYLRAVAPTGELLLTDDPFWDREQRLRSIRLEPASEDFAVRWQLDFPEGHSDGTGVLRCGSDLLLCTLGSATRHRSRDGRGPLVQDGARVRARDRHAWLRGPALPSIRGTKQL